MLISYGRIIMAILALILIISIPNSEAEIDTYINEALYSKAGTETLNLVPSGRDNGTYYKYLIIDDYSEAPENWSELGFNDTSWGFGAAPFGDRRYNNVDPITDWDTSGSSPYNEDIILIRHKFHMAGIVTEAEINVAFANYCTPYLNGNNLYEETGGNTHGAEYWNDDGTSEILPSYFTTGENLIAVYGRDYVYNGGQNRQWLDLQITASVFEPMNESIILGDTVVIAVEGGNKGDENAPNGNITFETNETTIEILEYQEMPKNYNDMIFVEWTPKYQGKNTLEISILCNCTDENMSNNYYILNITAGIYKLNANLDNELTTVNGSRIFSKKIWIQNEGNLTDNVSLNPSNGEINQYINFIPNYFALEPGEVKEVTIQSIIPDNIPDGFHNLSFKVESEHQYSVTRYLLSSGKDSETSWKWMQSEDYEKHYNNTNWTSKGFNDSLWNTSMSPFGDQSVDGINYRTLWEDNNYAYFRHSINISKVELYRNGAMNINVASNNFGDYYVNGILIFGDLDEGNGHGADYWNDEVQVYTNFLTEGENIIASIIGNPTNTQWFDQEIYITFPQANIWNYEDKSYDIPIYLDSEPPITKVNDQGFYKNNTKINLTWKEISKDKDIKGFYLYYQIKENNSLSNWQLINYYETEGNLSFTGQNNLIYRFKTIGVDQLGNLEFKGTYDTEIKIDLNLPKSNLWTDLGNNQFTNLNGIGINWNSNNTYDIQGYVIEYKNEDENSWNNFGFFTGDGEYWFEPSKDGTYFIRSIAIDYAGNRELKNIPDVKVTFDRLNPNVKLNSVDYLQNADDLILTLKTKSENLSNINVEYAILIENSEEVLTWKEINEDWDNENFTIRNLVDGYEYYFRINPTDMAGNENHRNEYRHLIYYEEENRTEFNLPVIPLKPIMTGKIKNIEITVDENLDGIYEKNLQEYFGEDSSAMKANQFRIDYDLGKLIFGNGNEGYIPTLNSSISIIYSAYDVKTLIDSTPPMSVQNVEYKIEENKNVTIDWEQPKDAEGYLIETRNNFSSEWEVLVYLNFSQNEMNYEIYNLSEGFHYYRIISIDRMGYQNADMKNEMIEIFILSETSNENEISNKEDNLNTYIAITGLLILFAGASVVYFMKNNEPEILDANEESILVPVEFIEEQNSIDNDTPAFTILQGSQFSRNTIFICNSGCQHEFELDEDYDENEIMCPHCGIMGDSPI